MNDTPLAAAGRALEHAYGDVLRTRMQGLPIVNAALRVELVGLRAWNGSGVGVLITPWCMNFVALPLGQDWPAVRIGTSQVLALPSGRYDMLAAHLPEVGPHLLGSLISPMQDFADQDAAVTAAHAAMDLLFEAPAAAPRPADTARRDFLLGRPQR